MALIGESGSGKSVTLRALMRLHPPGSSELSGTLQVGDGEVLTMSASQLRRYRGGRCAMIFQEPLLAFDPVYTVGQQIIEEAAPPRRAVAPGGPGQGAGGPAPGAHSQPRAAAGCLPARDVRRDAPAGDDRPCALL